MTVWKDTWGASSTPDDAHKEEENMTVTGQPDDGGGGGAVASPAASGGARKPPTPPESTKVHPLGRDDDVIFSKEAAFIDSKTGEKVEADTEDSEDFDIGTLVRDGVRQDSIYGSFGIFYNRWLLEGWVKQPSPCCAAASVAGAINGIRMLPRRSVGALDHRKVLSIMEGILQGQLDKKVQEVERLLGAEVAPFVDRVKEEVEGMGRTLGGKEKNGANEGAPRKLILSLMKKVVMEEKERRSEGGGEGGRSGAVEEELLFNGGGDCFDKLFPYYVEQREEDEEAGGEKDAEDEEDEDDEDEAPGDKKGVGKENKGEGGGSEVMVFDMSKKTAGKKGKKMPAWKSGMCEIFKKMGGLEKVRNKVKPSTAPFGNWGIIAAVRRVSEEVEGWKFSAEAVMGVKCKGSKQGYTPLSKADKSSDIQRQWDVLRSMLCSGSSALISHHKNHYAILFAAREWSDREGQSKRQVLTARKGQRPTTWIDFDELRNVYLSWEGYKLIRVKGVQCNSK